MSDAPILLITGVTGFLAAHVLDAALADPKGYRVRGTLRSMSKRDELLSRFSAEDAKRIELVEVAKTESSDLSEAVKGVSLIAHVASPYQLQVEDVERDLLVPAIEGTLNLLRYAAKEASVKRVAITSSFAAITDFTKGGPNRPGYTYTKEDWNPFTRQDAKGPVAYSVSKTLAEKAAWEFVKTERPGFTLATFNPPMIYGPTLQPAVRLSTLNTSSKAIYTLITSPSAVPDDRLPLFCHARDVGDAHVVWLSSNSAPSQRYTLYGGAFNWAMAVGYIARHYPELVSRLPKGYEEALSTAKDPKTSYASFDASDAEQKLNIRFKDWQTTLKESLDSLLELEKRPDWKD